MNRWWSAVCLIVITGLSLIAPAWANPPAAAQRAPLHVVASFSILADVTGQVAGGAVVVDTLIPLGANPHSYEPAAQDVVRLSEADAVLVVGMSFEEGLLSVLTEAAGERLVVVSACVPVRAIPQGVLLDDHDHAGEADHTDEVALGTDGIDCQRGADDLAAAFGAASDPLAGTLGALSDVDCAELGCDPHVWTDPVNVAWWALAIRDTLSALDPANADVYATNARAYLDDLAALHIAIADQLAAIPDANRYLVTNHQVFGYFAARYDLTPVGVVLPGGSTTIEPSVRDVLALIDTVRELGVPVIFTEPIASDDLARQIADEAGAVLVPLLTGSLGAPDSGASTYLDYMRHNAALIAEALVGG